MNFGEEKNYSENIMNAMKSGNETDIKQAIQNFHDSLVETLKQEYTEMGNDKNILIQRGYRLLTSKETKFYEKFIESAKTSNPKQALIDLISKNGMPETILEDVYKDLVEEHPLLSRINFRNVKYLTKWLLSDKTANKAIWGEITAAITEEISSSFNEINLEQGKLTAFVLISNGMLDLGPTFLDKYIRTILKEALYVGLEYGIVKGKGVKGEPVGLDKNLDASIDQTNGYAVKTKIKLKSFDTTDYCTLIANNLVKKGNHYRTLSKVQLLVHPIDYLKKVMPATTTKAPDGTYKNNLFPFPTEVIQTPAVNEGEAILCLLDEYFFGIGSAKDGVISYSDEVKFLEDKRAYKIKLYGAGRAEHNSSSVLLDISELEPSYVVVKQVTSA